jgi:hypothetical protein
MQVDHAYDDLHEDVLAGALPLTQRAHHKRSDNHTEAEVDHAYDDLHEDVLAGALPGGGASYC